MITIQHEDRQITAGIYGEFTLTDYRTFEAEVLDTLRLKGRVDLLMDLRDMLSYTLDVAWEDIRFVRAHAHDFRRVAVIARDQFTVWVGWLTRLMSDADVRVFDDEVSARDWLAEVTEPAAEDGFGTLVSVAALEKLIDAGRVVVFDCRHDLMNKTIGGESYARSHLPGARFAHVDRDLAGPLTGKNGRHPLPDRDTFVAWLGRMGVSNGTQVVAYDSGGGMYAARLWWMLRHWLGHAKVAVLDGGWDAWIKTGHPVTADVPVPVPATFVPKTTNATVDTATILAHLGKGDMRIVDARAADRFRGENETMDPVGGHIPGAVNHFFRANLDAMGFFKTPAELRAGFAPALAGTKSEQIVHQCGSGITAAHNLFAMEVAGITGTKLYPGSWSEWCADPARPVEK